MSAPVAGYPVCNEWTYVRVDARNLRLSLAAWVKSFAARGRAVADELERRQAVAAADTRSGGESYE